MDIDSDLSCQEATFPAPEQQLAHYRHDLNLRFGGIRKPRLGNKANLSMADSKGWTIGQGGGGGAGGNRNLNYSIAAVRQWYGEQQAWYHKINADLSPPAPVEFWWNDEGETDYFTFYYWVRRRRVAAAACWPIPNSDSSFSRDARLKIKCLQCDAEPCTVDSPADSCNSPWGCKAVLYHQPILQPWDAAAWNHNLDR